MAIDTNAFQIQSNYGGDTFEDEYLNEWSHAQ